MKREYYSSTIKDFELADSEWILGQLLINDEFETTDLQKNAWRDEIAIMKSQSFQIARGEIAFEYTIPRVEHRVDVVHIIDGTIFLLEFKFGDREYKKPLMIR